jgi:two-component system, chemotaxis family, chemotaxis protein CheY
MPFLRYPSTSAATPIGYDGNAVPQKILRILYAEDMPELREVARISISRDGHSVECAADGAQAFERITADPRPFDLLITDHHMPNLNGLELVMQLRVFGFPGKILVFSSELSREIHASYQRLNVDRILYKPVFPSTLRQVLGDLYPSAMASSPK